MVAREQARAADVQVAHTPSPIPAPKLKRASKSPLREKPSVDTSVHNETSRKRSKSPISTRKEQVEVPKETDISPPQASELPITEAMPTTMPDEGVTKRKKKKEKEPDLGTLSPKTQ